MNSTQLDPVAFTRLTQFTKHFPFLDFTATPPSTSAFLYLLPPCLALLVVDLVAQYSNRRSLIANAEESLKDKEEIERLGGDIKESLLKIEEMKKSLAWEQSHSRYLSRTIWKKKNFARHRERLQAYQEAHHTPEVDSPPRYTPRHTESVAVQTEKPTGVGAPFISFCERLLLQNKIWQQQQEIKKLKAALSCTKVDARKDAFQAFCDQLVLTNKIWRQQKEVDGLMNEAEQLKRSREAAVTRVATQMAQDVRKERLTEEFVTDLITELGECKETIVSLRADYEREIREMAEDYRKDTRKLKREIERLKLSLDARLLEQEMSNDMELTLVDRLSVAENHAFDLERQLYNSSATLSSGYISEDMEGWSGSEFDVMSNTSASTCVGSGGELSPNVKSFYADSPKGKISARRARAMGLSPLKIALRANSSSSLKLSPLRKASTASLDTIPLAVSGFSFNPLFFGNTTSRNDDASDCGSHYSRSRVSSMSSVSSFDSSFSESSRAGPSPKFSGGQSRHMPKPIPWRF
ncbi:hypothetical protein CVT26_001843 [Gymnopilus dilepis]|uniref:Uncharacterized protein n=1 Tax=Gymnopilus dilepis TaxID=231916 RepID=A0A409VRU9_9AGAR|nr:hypothetical protein CVT26_001843 [Gymnopilus dilepis]